MDGWICTRLNDSERLGNVRRSYFCLTCPREATPTKTVGRETTRVQKASQKLWLDWKDCPGSGGDVVDVERKLCNPAAA